MLRAANQNEPPVKGREWWVALEVCAALKVDLIRNAVGYK